MCILTMFLDLCNGGHSHVLFIHIFFLLAAYLTGLSTVHHTTKEQEPVVVNSVDKL